LIPLEPTRNPEYAAPVDPLETALADAAYLIQTLSELGNPPEMVMRQGERDPRIHEQSFQAEAAPINPNYVRYADPYRGYLTRCYSLIRDGDDWRVSGGYLDCDGYLPDRYK